MFLQILRCFISELKKVGWMQHWRWHCLVQGQLHACDFSVQSCQECVRVRHVAKMEKQLWGWLYFAYHREAERRLSWVVSEMTSVWMNILSFGEPVGYTDFWSEVWWEVAMQMHEIISANMWLGNRNTLYLCWLGLVTDLINTHWTHCALSLPCDMTLMPASAISKCSVCLPWLLLLPKICSLWLCQQKAWVTAPKPTFLQNPAVGANQSRFWCASTVFMLSFQQLWGLVGGIDIPAENLCNLGVKYLSWLDLWCQSIASHGKNAFHFPPLCGEIKSWCGFWSGLVQKKRNFFGMSSSLWVLWNSKLSRDQGAAALCKSHSCK